MDFPITGLMDQDACYSKLVGWLHPDGLDCPHCKTDDHLRVHRRHHAPVLDYRCTACGRVFTAFTATALAGSHRTPAEIVLILRGFAQGVPTAQLARELGCDRKHLLELRHLMQDDAARWLDRNPLGDEMYQNAGEKGIERPDPDDPPRYRANNRRGHGTFANDRPAVAGVVGRESGEIRLEVVASAGAEELDELVGGPVVPLGCDGEHRRVVRVQPGRWPSRSDSCDGGPLGSEVYLCGGRRRGRGA